MVRLRRWYQAHRPEAQRRRREAYAKEVTAKYPRGEDHHARSTREGDELKRTAGRLMRLPDLEFLGVVSPAG